VVKLLLKAGYKKSTREILQSLPDKEKNKINYSKLTGIKNLI